MLSFLACSDAEVFDLIALFRAVMLELKICNQSRVFELENLNYENEASLHFRLAEVFFFALLKCVICWPCDWNIVCMHALRKSHVLK